MTIVSRNEGFSMWYSASILRKGNSASRLAADYLWEDSIVLIEADSAEVAIAKANQLGLEGETVYDSATGEKIIWKFMQIERIYEIGESLNEGTEIFSRFLRDSEIQSLLTPFQD